VSKPEVLNYNIIAMSFYLNIVYKNVSCVMAVTLKELVKLVKYVVIVTE